MRAGAESAVVRAEGTYEARSILVEAELAAGRTRVQVNKQKLVRTRDLLGYARVSVFAPDDLELVKGGPSNRRRYLDDALVALHPRYDAVRAEVDRVLRQRNALLRQVHGRLDESAAITLDVWDDKLGTAGEELGRLRAGAGRAAGAGPGRGLRRRGGRGRGLGRVAVRYDSAWHGREGGLAAALAGARRDDLRRGVSTVGPHRDDLALGVAGCRPAPTRRRASSGRWPWPCAWPPTASSPPASALRRSCCSTTCSSSSTPAAATPCWPRSRPARPC